MWTCESLLIGRVISAPLCFVFFLVEETVKDRGYLLGVLGIGCPEADVACVFVEVT